MLILCPPEHSLRTSFMSGVIEEDLLAAHPVLARWARSRALRDEAAELPRASGHKRGGGRIAGQDAKELLTACPDLSSHGFAIVLTDHEGVIVASHGLELLTDG